MCNFYYERKWNSRDGVATESIDTKTDSTQDIMLFSEEL